MADSEGTVNRSYLTYIGALLLIVSPLRGATVSGQVIDESSQPLAGVRVNLMQVSLDGCCDDRTSVTASDDGSRLPVSRAGYARLRELL